LNDGRCLPRRERRRRILLGEPDAPAILEATRGFDLLVASRLLRVELRRLGLGEHRVSEADRLLAGIALVPVGEEVLAAAESVPPAMVTPLDAVHLVTALRLADAGAVDSVMTYDRRLAEGAASHGLAVVAPS